MTAHSARKINGRRQDCSVFAWGPVSSGDTCNPISPKSVEGLATNVQFIGTFGGTMGLQGSNDGVNWEDLKSNGVTIAATAKGEYEVQTSMAWIRPTVGSVGSVTILLSMRN